MNVSFDMSLNVFRKRHGAGYSIGAFVYVGNDKYGIEYGKRCSGDDGIYVQVHTGEHTSSQVYIPTGGAEDARRRVQSDPFFVTPRTYRADLEHRWTTTTTAPLRFLESVYDFLAVPEAKPEGDK